MLSLYKWWFLILPVILALPALFLDLEILFLLTPFLFLHLILGLQTIVDDYLHNKKTKVLLLVWIRVCNFEFLRYFVELLL